MWFIPKLILFTDHNERRDIPVQCGVISNSVGIVKKRGAVSVSLLSTNIKKYTS